MWRHPCEEWHLRHWRRNRGTARIDRMQTIDIVLYDGFDELDAIGPFEVLRNARFDATLVTLEGAREVTASHGLVVRAERALAERPDAVLVPGGGWNERGPQGARAEAERGALPARLRALAGAGVVMTSVCTGGMLLAAAGVTDGRPATTHHGALDDLRASGAEVVDERVVDDGDLVTSAGVTSGIDMALWLVEREKGAELADLIAREMAFERRGRVLR
jgi:transcriptional regulator GlxA family with amidase domain